MKKKITVIEVVGTMDRGGAETMLMNIFRKLHTDFRFVFLIMRKKGSQPIGAYDEEIKSLKGEFYYIDSVWDVGILAFFGQFKKAVCEIGQVDIVHSHLNTKGGVISYAAKKCGIKRRIVHSHARLKFRGSLLSRTAFVAEQAFQRLLINRYATDYWACSEDALKSLFSRKHCKGDHTQIIHNAIDLQRYLNVTTNEAETLKCELGICDDTLLIGAVGRIAEVKNYDLLIDILHCLRKRNINFICVIAGSEQEKDYSDSIRKKVNNLGLENNVIFLGARRDVECINKMINVFVGTSIREGLGLAAIEAQASGVSCVLSSGFPKDVDMSLGLVKFIDSKQTSVWVDAILCSYKNNIKIDKHLIAGKIRSNGYDINLEAEHVKNLFLGDSHDEKN